MKRAKRVRATVDEAPPGKLVEAAIAQIEQHGLSRLTVRAVAAAAGMNIAAVNYYFGSKEALVATALESSLRHFVKDAKEMVARIPEDPAGVLNELFSYMLEGSLRYPKVTKAHLHDVFTGDDRNGPFVRGFAPILVQLRDAIRVTVTGLDERQATRRVVAAISAIFFPLIFADLYSSLGALQAPVDRAKYIEEMARSVLAPV